MDTFFTAVLLLFVVITLGILLFNFLFKYPKRSFPMVVIIIIILLAILVQVKKK